MKYRLSIWKSEIGGSVLLCCCAVVICSQCECRWVEVGWKLWLKLTVRSMVLMIWSSGIICRLWFIWPLCFSVLMTFLNGRISLMLLGLCCSCCVILESNWVFWVWLKLCCALEVENFEFIVD